MKLYLIISITLIAFLFFPLTTSCSEDILDIKTIAIIPFDNLSDENYSVGLNLNNFLYDYLKREKFNVINKDVLEQFFIQRRIREIDSINRAAVREIGETLCVDAILMGSINKLSEDKNPKVDISVQMVDTLDASIIWMNSVAISGDAFTTFFGLGKIKSIEKLVEIAIRDLFKGLPNAFTGEKEKYTDIPPFEIVQARFYPKVVKGGSQIGLMVECREINSKPKQMYAFVKDIKVPLISDGSNYFTVSFKSPVVEGTYNLSLHVYGESNEPYIFDAMTGLIVDNTPPLIDIKYHNTLISPNDDGINDYIQFFPELLSTDSLKSWSFEVRGKEGKLIRSAEGGEDFPSRFIWKGENNNFKQVNDGIYLGQFFVEDKAGHEVSTDKVMIIVDRRPPEIEIVQGKIEEDIVSFDVKCNNISEIVEWSIIIYNQNYEHLGAFSGKQDFPSILNCAFNNKDGAHENIFFYSLEVRDAAGNILNVERHKVEVYKPNEVTEKKDYEWVNDF